MWAPLVTLLRTWGLVALLITAGVAVVYRFVAPAPPSVVRLATGPPDGAYQEAAEAYARRLEREGFTVHLRPTRGTVDNLRLLRAREVDLALVQGGVPDPSRDTGLVSLGAVFHEPVWVFVRDHGKLARMKDFEGRRVAIGPEGSGTRALALALLEANDLGPDAVTTLPLTGVEAADALMRGEADAAIFVSARLGGGIARLMHEPEAAPLVDFEAHAAAYAMRLPYLAPVRLPRGGFSLSEDLPAEDIVLMAPSASVAAHEDIHPQIVSLVVRVMREVHRHQRLFASEEQFPNPLNQGLPLHRDARRYYEHGPGFLQSYLPFWVAVTIERLWVLAIPLVTLALPLIRFAPPLYSWQMESRIYRWYEELRRIEADIPKAGEAEARNALRKRLAALEGRVARIGVPASYGRHLFALRRDIAYVRLRLTEA